MGAITAYETRASGVPWNFSPVLDLGRQPIWSRFFETLGEDVYLVKTMGKSIINGYQGNGMIDKYHVAACLKHYVGYSYPSSGRDRTPALIPERTMEEYYLPPFKEAIDAGALTVMINSGEVNGIPGHANKYLLTDVLKDKWGFSGFTVSDWEDFINYTVTFVIVFKSPKFNTVRFMITIDHFNDIKLTRTIVTCQFFVRIHTSHH